MFPDVGAEDGQLAEDAETEFLEELAVGGGEEGSVARNVLRGLCGVALLREHCRVLMVGFGKLRGVLGLEVLGG